jgi:hypothetical protein
MAQHRGLRIAAFLGVFTAGVLCGQIGERRAGAQLGELGGEALKKAGESGGPAGSIVQLGQSITDMEQHVSALQKNLETLKKVKSALGG